MYTAFLIGDLLLEIDYLERLPPTQARDCELGRVLWTLGQLLCLIGAPMADPDTLGIDIEGLLQRRAGQPTL